MSFKLFALLAPIGVDVALPHLLAGRRGWTGDPFLQLQWLAAGLFVPGAIGALAGRAAALLLLFAAVVAALAGHLYQLAASGWAFGGSLLVPVGLLLDGASILVLLIWRAALAAAPAAYGQP